MDHFSMIRAVAGTFLSKGYDRNFIATSFSTAYNLDCIEKIEAALTKYFLETAGKAKEDIKPLSLLTYLKWNGEDKEFVTASMKLAFKPDIPILLQIEIQKHRCVGGLERTVKLSNLNLGYMPSVPDAIKIANGEIKFSPVVPKSKKNRL